MLAWDENNAGGVSTANAYPAVVLASRPAADRLHGALGLGRVLLYAYNTAGAPVCQLHWGHAPGGDDREGATSNHRVDATLPWN